VKARCESFLSKPRLGRRRERHPEVISGLCPGCGGGPPRQLVVTYLSEESILSWNRETATGIDTTSNLELGAELFRRGSKKAIGEMKRFITNPFRSNRSSDGSVNQLEAVSETESYFRRNRSSDDSASQLKAVSETESPSGGENTTLCPRACKQHAQRKSAIPSIFSQARNLPSVTEDLSAPILTKSTTTTTMNVIRPTPGYDIETSSTVTTWSSIIARAKGVRNLWRVEELASPDERQSGRIEVPARHDERLAGVEVSARVGGGQNRRVKESTRPDEIVARRVQEFPRTDERLAMTPWRVEELARVRERLARRVQELARADARLARVRDGRGYIKFNVV
jgi:hypothetical protein